MANFNISTSALNSALNNIGILHQPSATSGGTTLTDQGLCLAFEQAGEHGKSVRLIEFNCTNAAENRTRSFTPAGASEKLTMVNRDSMQQAGTAKVEVEINGVKNTFEVKMHTPVALGFVTNDTQVLIGSTGEITMGRNKDKKWLSLRLPSPLSAEQMKVALESVKTPTTPQVVGA